MLTVIQARPPTRAVHFTAMKLVGGECDSGRPRSKSRSGGLGL